MFDVVYELWRENGGTRLTQRDDVELTGLPRILHPIGRHNIGRHLDEQFAALERLLEQPVR